MKTIGFPISHKNNEKRRALLPDDLENIKIKTFYILRMDTEMY